MKNWMFLSMAFALLPLSMMAQDDDMYFGSAKTSKSSTRVTSTYEPTRVTTPDQVYHSGSRRSVDEYNRRGSSYETLPNDSDIIDFSAVEGVYPDSTADYQLTRKMARWDGYTPRDAYWEGYSDGSHDSWMWHSPWYYSSFYPWYDSWYYPYWHYGWYDPWYYDYGWGWHYPYYRYSYYGGYYSGYYGGTSRHYGTGITGTKHHSGNYISNSYSQRVTNYTNSSRFDGARNRASEGNSGRRTIGTSTRSSTRATAASRSATRSTSSGNYDSGRSFSNSSSGSLLNSSRSSSSSYSGGGSNYSGSSRSSGGFSGGGTRSGGGGGGVGARSGGGRR